MDQLIPSLHVLLDTPYVEKGPLTKLAEPRLANRLNKAFGGPWNLVGFGFWFN